MKARVLFAFAMLMFSTNIFACVIPTKSEEIDKLISLSWDESLFTYFVRFPNEAYGQKFNNVTLNISNDGSKFETVSAELKPYSENGKLMARVQVFANLNKDLSVSVWWQGENDLCPIIGEIRLLKQ